MENNIFTLFIIIVFFPSSIISSNTTSSSSTFYTFPSSFIWGLSQDAYQFEGSIATSFSGEIASSLHTWCEYNLGQVNGYKLCADVGSGFYQHALDDVELLSSLGQKNINLEIAWSRIFPDGVTPDEIALERYSSIIDSLLANQITPWVSLVVLDLPQVFVHKFGGWIGRSMIDAYTSFATFVFTRFGNRVTHWFSFHEPNSICASYPTGGRFVGPRPNVNDSSIQDPPRDHYQCIYHVMLSHASAASVLRSLYPNSTLSIISDSAYLIPNTTSSEDIAASERYLIWHLGSYFEPLITGDWPPEMRAADPSGVRLPFFSPDESKLMKNSVAYLGLDFYTTMLVSSSSPNNCPPNSTDGFESDLCVTIFCGNDKRCPPNPNPNPHMSWLHYEPIGLRKTLSWMSKRWPTLPLLIAENGVGLDGGSNGDPTSSGDFLIDTNDQAKIYVLSGFWEQAWLSINEDNVDLRGIFVWSFLDNLEWDSGYSAHFGLVHVNHSRVDLQRTPKLSALWYQKVIQENGFEMPSRLA